MMKKKVWETSKTIKNTRTRARFAERRARRKEENLSEGKTAAPSSNSLDASLQFEERLKVNVRLKVMHNVNNWPLTGT